MLWRWSPVGKEPASRQGNADLASLSQRLRIVKLSHARFFLPSAALERHENHSQDTCARSAPTWVKISSYEKLIHTNGKAVLNLNSGPLEGILANQLPCKLQMLFLAYSPAEFWLRPKQAIKRCDYSPVLDGDPAVRSFVLAMRCITRPK
jgi:hypothetical protein